MRYMAHTVPVTHIHVEPFENFTGNAHFMLLSYAKSSFCFFFFNESWE